MNAAQRKTHVVLWLVIAITIPLVIFLSIKNLAFGSKNPYGLQEYAPVSFDVVKKIEDDTVLIEVGNSKFSLSLKKPLEQPSSLLFVTYFDGEKEFLETIVQTGQYLYDIKKPMVNIEIVDRIKKDNFKIYKF